MKVKKVKKTKVGIRVGNAGGNGEGKEEEGTKGQDGIEHRI